MTLEQRKQKLREDFKILPTWEDKFLYLLDMTREVNPLPDPHKTQETYIQGCQSDAWLLVRQEERNIHIRGDAAAITTKGIIGLLIFLYSGISPEELKEEDFKIFEELHIINHLSPNRVNGFYQMIGRLRRMCADVHGSQI